jgi:MAF protein
MRKIYLASRSQARKNLLQNLGLKFRVLPSSFKEKRHKGRLSYADMVKNNALKKAGEVAARVKSGIIIAADTVSVQDKKIFGKPKDLKEARSMLKKFSQKPQTVYTGLAVIDKDKNKTGVTYEKTRVYMDKLTDKDIENYFARVSPLDKAGGFDIQGKGAFFIRRIEGCFYNVVGLPLRKLHLMFKKLDIKVFILILPTIYCLLSTVFLSGCSTEYNVVTGKEETYYYSTDKEVQMGKAMARQVEEQYKLADDPLIQDRVKTIGKKIASVCDRKDIDYHFKVLNDEEINAFSLPGGYVYVNKGLIEKVSSDDELAAVLAHEVGHIVARHSIKKLQAMMGYSLIRILVSQAPSSGDVGTAADVAFTQLMLGYSRQDELLADTLGARYARLAGYNPHAMITFLKKLQDINRRKPLQPMNYFKTHPYVPDRIRTVKQELGESINFSDYINIEDQKE